MRFAAIDIGTNSVLLLLVERSTTGELQVLHEDCRITRLGQGVDSQGTLQAEAVTRTLAALADYAKKLDQFEVSQRAAVGTSALRDATNGATFVQAAEALLGCPLEVISGAREASLVLRGVATSCSPLGDQTLIVDIGGGSTELIRTVSSSTPLSPATPHVSLNIGTVRLTERHIKHDPPHPTELAALRQAIRATLATVSPPLLNPAARLIGVAGTVTTLFTIEHEQAVYDANLVNGGKLSRQQIEQLGCRLASLALEHRRQLPGLPTARADVIVAGALLVAELMDSVSASLIEVSDRGVRWGLIAQLVAEMNG